MLPIKLVCLNSGADASWFRSRIATLSRGYNTLAENLSRTYDRVYAQYTTPCTACSRSNRRRIHRELAILSPHKGYSCVCPFVDGCCICAGTPTCARVQQLHDDLMHTCAGVRSSGAWKHELVINSYHLMVRLKNHKLMTSRALLTCTCVHVRDLERRFNDIGLGCAVIRAVYNREPSPRIKRLVASIAYRGGYMGMPLGMIPAYYHCAYDRVSEATLELILNVSRCVYSNSVKELVRVHENVGNWLLSKYIVTYTKDFLDRKTPKRIFTWQDVPENGYIRFTPQ